MHRRAAEGAEAASRRRQAIDIYFFGLNRLLPRHKLPPRIARFTEPEIGRRPQVKLIARNALTTLCPKTKMFPIGEH